MFRDEKTYTDDGGWVSVSIDTQTKEITLLVDPALAGKSRISVEQARSIIGSLQAAIGSTGGYGWAGGHHDIIHTDTEILSTAYDAACKSDSDKCCGGFS